jgi:replicative DNA helicase
MSFDIDIEQNYLGALMLLGSNEPADEVSRFVGMLSEDDFSVMDHVKIYSTIKRMANRGDGFDLVLVSDELEREYKADAPSFAYLGEITKNATSAASISQYVKQIKDRGLKRKGLELSRKIYDVIANTDDVRAALGSAESMIQALMDRAVSGQSSFRHVSDVLNDYVRQLEHDIEHPDEVIGVSSGYDGMDDMLGRKRIQRGSLVVVGARPAMGKTSYMIGMVSNNVNKQPGSQSLIYSLEMPEIQLVDRMVSHGSGVSYDDLLMPGPGQDSDYNFARMAEFSGKLNQSEIYINDTSNIRVEQIMMEAREMARKKPIDVIAVDYLTLITAPDAERNDLRVGEITKALKRLAKELDCVVVLLSQLSRDLEKRRDKRPVNSDLRDSGQIEQDADYIIMLYRDIVYDPNTHLGNLAEAILRKNRFGAVGTVYHNFESGRWVDIDQSEGERIYQSNVNNMRDEGLI